jgi:hypothetical protein
MGVVLTSSWPGGEKRPARDARAASEALDAVACGVLEMHVPVPIAETCSPEVNDSWILKTPVINSSCRMYPRQGR